MFPTVLDEYVLINIFNRTFITDDGEIIPHNVYWHVYHGTRLNIILQMLPTCDRSWRHYGVILDPNTASRCCELWTLSCVVVVGSGGVKSSR